ncbi:MAG: hypothetical protein CMH57_01115 [Myxococcales bacterium]|nr:hypothetical protein [Myxococcales bacterium]
MPEPAAIHPDPHLPATVNAKALPWEPSPAPGVERRRLERTGGERARVTSLVRYAPETGFPAHEHGGGEEFLVLSGVFSDETGDHPAGSYVRNGVGTRHAPHTDAGCVIFVKLWWMHPDETGLTRVNTRDEANWGDAPWGARLPLYEDAREQVELWRLRPGAVTEVTVEGGLEVFVVSGSATLGDDRLSAWSWARRPQAGVLTLATLSGATVYLKRGHLADLPPTPDA